MWIKSIRHTKRTHTSSRGCTAVSYSFPSSSADTYTPALPPWLVCLSLSLPLPPNQHTHAHTHSKPDTIYWQKPPLSSTNAPLPISLSFNPLSIHFTSGYTFPHSYQAFPFMSVSRTVFYTALFFFFNTLALHHLLLSACTDGKHNIIVVLPSWLYHFILFVH